MDPGSYRCRRDVTSLDPSSLPGLRLALGVAGAPTGPAAPAPPCLCCCSVPAVRALVGEGVATPRPRGDRRLPGFAESRLWVWSVQTPCFKGDGRELASKASPPLSKNFFLFLNHHVLISHWNKVSF